MGTPIKLPLTGMLTYQMPFSSSNSNRVSSMFPQTSLPASQQQQVTLLLLLLLVPACQVTGFKTLMEQERL
jgi:hypothetical protein